MTSQQADIRMQTARAEILGHHQRENLFKVFSYALLIAFALAILLPFFWMLSTAFKEERGLSCYRRSGSRTR